LSNTLYTRFVKFLASISEPITKTLFQFVVICKMASMWCILYSVGQALVGGCQVWAVSRMGKNSPSHFCKICRRCVNLPCKLYYYGNYIF
jgi:hypothetical protein